MGNVKLEDLNESVRKSVRFLAEFGGLNDDYQAAYAAHYKNPNMLVDLQNYIENKNYKSLLALMKNEYPFLDVEVGGVVGEDEKLIRISLRSVGFVEDDFFNPKFDKGNLVNWTSPRDNTTKLYKVDYPFKDGGAYFYNLRDLESGTQVGGRLKQDELSEPTAESFLNKYTDEEKHVAVVYKENTLGYAYKSENSLMMGVLGANIIDGGLSWKNGPIFISSDDIKNSIRVAKKEDFDRFKVSIDGYLQDKSFVISDNIGNLPPERPIEEIFEEIKKMDEAAAKSKVKGLSL